MKKNILLLFTVLVLAINAKSQVLIGGTGADKPDPGAALELKSGALGFLPTRVSLISLDLPGPLPAHKEGMIVYNTKVSENDKLQAGFYYNTGERWIRLSTTPSFSNNWFYMPSIVFDTSAKTPSGENKVVDLYGEFKKQLNDNANAGVVASAGAPGMALSTVPAPTDLNYYVTAYDHKVFEIAGISVDGKMTYRIVDTASDSTYINIVFVEK